MFYKVPFSTESTVVVVVVRCVCVYLQNFILYHISIWFSLSPLPHTLLSLFLTLELIIVKKEFEAKSEAHVLNR